MLAQNVFPEICLSHLIVNFPGIKDSPGNELMLYNIVAHLHLTN